MMKTPVKFQYSLMVLITTFCGIWLFGLLSTVGLVFKQDYDMVYTLSVVVSFLLLPYGFVSYLEPGLNRDVANYCRFWLPCLIISLLSSVLFNVLFGRLDGLGFLGISLKYGSVAFSEELLCRYYSQNLLEKELPYWLAICLQAALFSFALHSGFPFHLNLLLRFPIGIILTIICQKTKSLPLVMGIHYLYDMVIHLLWL